MRRTASKHLSAMARRLWATYSFNMRAIRWNQEEATVKLQEGDAQPGGLADSLLLAPASPLAAIAGFVSKTLAIAELEIRKLRHDFTELVTRAVQPALWLLLFGQVFTRARVIPTG